MELAPRLVPLFWGALALLGIAGIIFAICVALLFGTQRPTALRVAWISGSVAAAAASAVLLILVHG